MTSNRTPTEIPWRRVSAFAIDLVVVVVVTAVVYRLLATRIGGDVGASGCDAYDGGDITSCVGLEGSIYVLEGGRAVLFGALALAVWLGYLGALAGAAGATLGKRLLDLRVVRADGSACGVWRGMLRQVTLLAGWLTLGFGLAVACLIGAVMVFVHPRNQRVGDLLARTYVVRSADAGRPPFGPDPAADPPGPAPPVAA